MAPKKGFKTDQVSRPENHSGTDKVFQCAQCSYTAKHKFSLVSHMMCHRTASDTTMYKCDVCQHETKRKADLRVHMIIHKDPADVKLFYCAHCSYQTMRKCDLKNHVTIHQAASYKCPDCSYTTNNKRYLEGIHSLNHKDKSEVKIYECELCGYQTRLKHSFKKHLEGHNKQPKPNDYQCNWCDFKTIYKQNLKQHFLYVHTCPTEIRMFRCHTCSYQAKSKSDMNKHIKMVHAATEAKFLCAHCPFKAKLKSYLKKHLVLHQDPSKVRMFHCDICQYKSVRKGSTKLHMQVHTKNKNVLRSKKRSIVAKKCKSKNDSKKMDEEKDYKIDQESIDIPWDPKDEQFVTENNSNEMADEDSKITNIDVIHTVTESKFLCAHCPYKTKLKSCLKKHVVIHRNPSKVRMFHCDVCEYKSIRKTDIGRHMQVHTKKKNNAQPGKKRSETVRKSKSENDSKKMDEENDDKIDQEAIDIPTNNKRYLEGILSLDHKDKSEVKIYECELCGYQARFKKSLKRHLESHNKQSKPNDYQCNWCDFKTIHKQYLKQHFLYVHTCPSEVKMFRCHLCSYQAKSKSDLSKHIKTVHTAMEAKFFCAHCPFKAKLKSYLKKHLVLHQDPSTVRMFHCDICEYKSVRKGNFKLHMQVHTKNKNVLRSEKRSITARKCKSKNDSKKIDEEKDYKISEVKIYECEICGYQARLKNSFKKHLKSHNKQPKPNEYQCNWCDFKTIHKQYLKQHFLYVHTCPSEVKMFRCHLCSYQAKSKSDLSKHIKMVHTATEAKFLCAHCPFKAKLKSYLRKHLVLHQDPSKVRMFHCDICEYKSVRKGNIKLHMQVHTKNKNVLRSEKRSITARKCKLKNDSKKMDEEKDYKIDQESIDIPWDPKDEQFVTENNSNEMADEDSKITNINVIHTVTESKFLCAHCPYKTKLKSCLKKHVVIHRNPSKVRMFHCDVCGYKSIRKTNIRRHMQVHTKKKNAQPGKKRSETVRKSESKNDSKKMDEENDDKIDQEAIDIPTNNKRYLEGIHSLDHNDKSEVKIYECELCGYQTRLKNSFKKHLEGHNKQPKPNDYQCNWCDFKTIHKQYLKQHFLYVHTCPSEMKMFRCHTCSYQAKLKSDLTKHIKMVHTATEAKFLCAHCPFKAKLKSYLKKHLVLHQDPSKVRMFHCDICEYKSVRKGNIKLHMQVHTKNKNVLRSEKRSITARKCKSKNDSQKMDEEKDYKIDQESIDISWDPKDEQLVSENDSNEVADERSKIVQETIDIPRDPKVE